MSPAPIPGQPQELDLRAVQRDARWLDDLAARAPVPADRRALVLLQALSFDVDAGLAELLDEPLTTAAPKGGTRTSQSRRRLGARAVVAGVVATGLLSVSGVAAAVTGDALSPYRSVMDAVVGAPSHADEVTAETARVNSGLSAVSAAIGEGRLAHAQVAIDRLRARIAELPERKRPDARLRLDMLQARLAVAAARQDARLEHARGLGLVAAPGLVGVNAHKDGNVSAPGTPSAGKPTTKPGRQTGHPKAKQGRHGRAPSLPTPKRGTGGRAASEAHGDRPSVSEQPGSETKSADHGSSRPADRTRTAPKD